MKDFSLLLLFLSSILLFSSNNIFAQKNIDEQISFELDSIKFAKYLDESKESIQQFYIDFGDKKITTMNLSEDSCFCNDTLKVAVEKNYKPFGWALAGLASGAILNIVGGAGTLIANEKLNYSTNDSLQMLEERCSAGFVQKEKAHIRFRYTTYGIIGGIILNTVFLYYKSQE